LHAGDVKEVVVLGDLFDQWVIPTDEEPVLSYEAICANPVNAPVIEKLKALAAAEDVKLAYVPGNHDMGMNKGGIAASRQFLETTFPNIRFICNSDAPLGSYNVGTLSAEHGDRYCLFNAPDDLTASDTFLPLGYFISRLVARKVRQTGSSENAVCILASFLKNFMDTPEFIPDMFVAIAKDAGLKESDAFNLAGVPGFPAKLTVGKVARRFADLIHKWDAAQGKVNSTTAIMSDIGNLWFAANSVFRLNTATNINIVIFGHTHIPAMNRFFLREPGKGADKSRIPCRSIYANCGSWVDQQEPKNPNPRTGNVAAYGCTYVETEELADKRRHYVRVKSYTDNETIEEGFVEM
jgi:UDP-2,3-diacylglucosamine pyrophosphatase LpxH